jgi:hypothetical protein
LQVFLPWAQDIANARPGMMHVSNIKTHQQTFQAAVWRVLLANLKIM